MTLGRMFLPFTCRACACQSHLLLERQVRILWASWHVVTVMGWCLAVVLFWLVPPSSRHIVSFPLPEAIAISLFASSMLVLLGTKGRAPRLGGPFHRGNPDRGWAVRGRVIQLNKLP